MANWYVKDLSKLTGVSVQTLHYYDHIGLVKPSIRLNSGYRLYSEKDLLKLQQIIALKFFGFQLSKITSLLSSNIETLENFEAQAQFLEEKSKNLFEASQMLKNIISECGPDKSIALNNIIKSIEVYRMTQALENTWEGKVLTHEELKEYAKFQDGLKTRFTEEGKKDFSQKWVDLVAETSRNLDKDPRSNLGAKIAKELMDWVCTLYGKEHANLRRALWEKGFKTGKADGVHAMDPQIVIWMDEAIDHYYRGRIRNILDMSSSNSNKAEALWNELMDEMCGNAQNLRDEIFNAIMEDDKTSSSSKKWLERISI